MEASRMIKGYELHERIGSGGFGVVHRAYQATVGREVAIKIILPHFANDPDFIRRFEAEAQLIARLEHPYIVPLYDYWRDPDGAYLVMRWLRGGNLRDALLNGPFGLEAAALLMDQVASALALAHRNDVIHRDLKPANILLDEDGNAYLSDFGIAKDTGRTGAALTEAGAVLGSLDYLSPEQARSEPVTPQADIYSLGVVLYEVLAGQHPFPNMSSVERMYKHLNEPLPLIDTLPAEIAEGVNAIIQKATAKNPARRYTDVLAMAVDFRRETTRSLQPGDNLVEQLTFREQEILQMIVDGCSNKDIAQRLFITVSTVKWHVRQVYQKLRVRSRVQAMVRARELNLLVSDTATEPTVSESTYIALPEPENPYKGLRAFQVADARDFFGRERLVQRMVKRLGEREKLSRFLAVIGPSGSGKSSVVKAGLIPALWRGDLPGSERWFVVEMIPGAHPLDELEIALTRVAANQASNLREHLERDARGLVRVAGLILPDDGSDLVILVDQFEEIFTLVEDETERSRFLDLLFTAVTDPRSRARIVITLRADFYDRPLNYPDFGELVRSRMETVLPLSADELEAAITRPAARVGVSFEPGLVATITSDVHYQPGALPLLQYALTELFEQRSDHVLTHEAYQSLGGAAGALAKRAEELYYEQVESGQETIRQMFLRLVSLGEGAEDTRRRVPRSELLAIPENEDLMDEAVDTYAAYRLLTLDHDPYTRSPTVEIAHEAILREWEQLRTWLNESRHDIRQQRHLAAAGAEWLEAGRDPSYLLAGSRLAQFEGWSGVTEVALTQTERGFLDASVAERQRQEDTERERQLHELELAQQAAESAQQAAVSAEQALHAQRSAAHRLRFLVMGLAVFLVVAVFLSLFAFDQRNKAQNEADQGATAQAVAQQSANESLSLALASGAREASLDKNPDLALALAIEANTVPQALPQVDNTLADIALAPGPRRVFTGHTGPVMAVAVSPDGRYLLTGSGNPRLYMPLPQDNTMRLWDMLTGVEIRRFEGFTDAVWSLAFSPDGRTAFSASADGRIYRWDLATGQIIRRYSESDGYVLPAFRLAVSPDGQFLLEGDFNGRMRLFDVETGKELRSFSGVSETYDLSFSPDGRSAYFGGVLVGEVSGSIAVWDVFTSTEIRHFEATDTSMYRTGPPDCSVAFSPDGRTALGVQEDQFVLYDTSTGAEIRRFNKVHTGWVNDMVISRDGRRALTASEDATVILWNLDTGVLIRQFQGHQGSVMSVAFTPDELQAVSGSTDGTARLWDLDSGNEVRALRAEGFDQMWGLAVSPDGHTALTGAKPVVGSFP